MRTVGHPVLPQRDRSGVQRLALNSREVIEKDLRKLNNSKRECNSMPVLTAEPCMFPDDLFDNAELPEAADRQWSAIHTRPKQEKALARQLGQSQTPFYLPVEARQWRSRNREMTSYMPLFPSYVFVFANPDERIAALATRRIVQSLEVAEQETLWDDLRQISRLISSGAPITREARAVPGTVVEIRNGPLAGLRGTVIRSAAGRRFVVQVDFIQQGASVLLDDCDLEVIGYDQEFAAQRAVRR